MNSFFLGLINCYADDEYYGTDGRNMVNFHCYRCFLKTIIDTAAMNTDTIINSSMSCKKFGGMVVYWLNFENEKATA